MRHLNRIEFSGDSTTARAVSSPSSVSPAGSAIADAAWINQRTCPPATVTQLN